MKEDKSKNDDSPTKESTEKKEVTIKEPEKSGHINSLPLPGKSGESNSSYLKYCITYFPLQLQSFSPQIHFLSNLLLYKLSIKFEPNRDKLSTKSF